MAQPPEGGRERREGFGGPPGGFMRFSPLLSTLDADHDGVISASEIANASKALLTLDKNGDGKLSAEEMRPAFGGRGPGGPGGPERRRENSADDLVKTLMAFDKNGDGKLSKEELPERMQGMFARRRKQRWISHRR
jgi:Ca2+-binding EF-hand superfamily protein